MRYADRMVVSASLSAKPEEQAGPPSDAEKQECLKYVRESGTEAEGMRGVMWSLLNTREFLLQH